jgi:hypothetical protein
MHYVGPEEDGKGTYNRSPGPKDPGRTFRKWLHVVKFNGHGQDKIFIESTGQLPKKMPRSDP